jgi:predicted MFS family arabinose efflux permease
MTDAEVSEVPTVAREPRAKPLARVDPLRSERPEFRIFIVLGLGTFVTALLTIGPTPFFPQIATDLEVTVPLLGQVMSVMLLMSALFGLVTGPLADRSGYRALILAGLVAAVVCLLSFGFAPAYPVLFLASFAGAVTTAAVVGPSYAVASTGFTGATARRAVGWTNGAQAGSAIVGVPLLTAVGAALGWRTAFVAAAIAAAAVFFIAAAGIPRDRPPATEPLGPRVFLAPYRQLFAHDGMRRLYTVTFLTAVCWFGFVTYLGAFLASVLGLRLSQIGLVYMVSGFCYFAGSMTVGGPLARVSANRLVVAGFGIMALCWAAAFSAWFGLMGSVILIGAAALAMGTGVVSVIALLSAETPTGRGTTLTLNTALHKIGSAGGGAIGGLLLAFGGHQTLGLVLPAFGVAAALLTLSLRVATRSEQ